MVLLCSPAFCLSVEPRGWLEPTAGTDAVIGCHMSRLFIGLWAVFNAGQRSTWDDMVMDGEICSREYGIVLQ